MTDDDLRTRLAALDPEAGRVVAPLTASQKEHAMRTTDPDHKAVLGMTAACLAVVGSGIAVALVFSGGENTGSNEGAPSAGAKKTVLQLTEAAPNAAMMCVQLSPEVLRGAAHAFEGKATSVEAGTTSFDVTHWYKGGDQQVVTLTSQGSDTVEDGIAFEAGKTYLVAAAETEVSGCSGTGEETAALKAMFDDAFS